MESIKTIGILITGWFFVLLGILGLFLPVLQGILFIMIGLAILSTRSELVQRLLRRFEQRYPQYHAKVEEMKRKVLAWFKRK
jgi:hypothetical protein